MTSDEFFHLVRPFVAGVGDAHTNFLGGYEVDRERPGGLPLRFRVVEQSLVVAGVSREQDRGWLGSRLLSVEGVPLGDLLDRQRRLRGIDNPYHGLQTLADEFAASRDNYIRGEAAGSTTGFSRSPISSTVSGYCGLAAFTVPGRSASIGT